MARASRIKRNLVTGTLLMASALTGYGRRAFAGCYSTGAPNYLCSGANYTPLSVTANNATVTTDNTFSVNTGGGDALSITGDGNLISFTDPNHSPITASSGNGIQISATGDVGGTGGVSVNASGPILAYAAGVDARNYGGGALSVTTTGHVTATGMDYFSFTTGLGIYARNYGTDLTINSAKVDGSLIGIFARNYGSGALQITSTGDVFGGSSGIYAINNGTDLSITTGRVTSNGGGIYGRNLGTGALSITATGDVVAANFGVYATNYNGTDVNVNVGYVRGNGGVAIKDFGTGALNLTATGTINSNGGEAVRAWGFYANSMSINVQDVSGSIEASHYSGSGALTVNAGNVTGGIFAGISAYNWSYDGTDVTVTANSVTETSTDGIRAGNHGTGSLSISVSGDVNAGFFGIYASNYSTNLTINARNVYSYGDGIEVNNHGSGAATITAANVTGTYGYGIRARNYGTDLNISAANVSGYDGGVFAFNHGSGALSITTTGNVSAFGNAALYVREIDGIYARNYGTNLTITANNVSGGLTGINAINHGTGSLSITTTGDVTGTVGNGISAVNYGTDLTINAGAVAGYFSAIYAINHGSGSLSISASGDVTTPGFAAIVAENYGQDLSISTTGQVTTGTGSGQIGMQVTNLGTGALTINAVGDITADTGIWAKNYGTDLSISTGEINSRLAGIRATNYGIGALTIASTGDINGGVYALNSGTNLSVNVTNVTSGSYGILARNGGSGALIINAGNVTASYLNTAIGAYNSGTDLTITAGSITTTYTGAGIRAFSEGSGALSITLTGDMQATNSLEGIDAVGYGTNLSINTRNIHAYGYGVYAQNNGTGALSITTGDVTADTGSGIIASNHGTDLTINADSVHGGPFVGGGIVARNYGSGALSITATGHVVGAGMNSYVNGDGMGIYARNDGTNLTINAAGVSGYLAGIYARNNGSGALSITTTGDVTSATGDAIYARNNGSGPLNINIPSGVSVHGGETGIDIGGNAGAGSSGITTAGNITGDNGTAISLNNLTANTPITVNGGTINGDVIDSHPAGGFSTVTFTQNFATNGNFNVSGIEVSAGKTLTAGSGDTLAANTFTFDILNKTTFGKIGMTNTAFSLRNPISANDGQIFVNVTGTDNLNGHKFQIVDGDGTHAVVNGPGNALVAVTDNSALWDFDVVNGIHFGENASDLFLKAKKDHTNNGSIANTNSLNTLLSLGDTSNPQLLEAMGNINTAPTDGALDSVLASTLPDISGSDYAASQGADDTMNALEETRLASLRAGDDDESGMAAGDMAKGFGVWGQVFGQHADQGERDAVAGYTANTWGGAVGVDTTNIADHAVIGLAFSYGRTNASSDNANTTDTDIDSYQLSIYADYDLAKNTYLSGMAGVTWGNVDTERHNVTGVPGLTAHGSYNTQQFAAQVEAGHDFAVGDGMTLTPNVLAHWTNWNPDSYTETGAGGANMHVEGDNLDKFELGAGLKAGWSLKNHDGSVFKPELRASYRYDLENDRIDDTAQFTGGGVAFSVPGPDPARGTVDLGASMKLMTTNNWTFTASYDFNWKDQYTAHSGFLRAGYRF